MPINPNLLISAPMLQDYLVDKSTGFPLAGGIISLYNDNARTFYKNWYYQTGLPGNYTYIPLDNPLTLSSVGTIQDPNGNDVIPFYYPYDETNENVSQPYYITVYSTNSDGNPSALQFTRENFPFLPVRSSSSNTPTLRNYIINNVYWHNCGSVNLTNVTNMVVAASQHEGYVGNGDIRFIKDVTGGNDSIQFLPMPTTIPIDLPTPEFYLNLACTAGNGELEKCIQYPVSLHISTLQNIAATFVFYAQNVSGNTNNTLTIAVYQYLGTGATSQPAPIIESTVTLSNLWERYAVQFTFPDASQFTSPPAIGAGGDDALFIRIRYPLGVAFAINHTKPQLYLSQTVPDNDFDTYDQIASITASPRTGDYKFSTNNFIGYDWIPCTGGTIGNSSSNASYANKYSWPLYSYLWNLFNGTMINGLLFLNILNSDDTQGSYGLSAIADFNANKQISLTKSLGYVMAGGSVLNTPQTVTRSSNNLTASSFSTYFTGIPILFTTTGTLPGGLSTNTIYFCIFVNMTTIQVATTFANALAGTNITLTSNGTGIHTVNTTMAGTYFGETSHTQTQGELVGHFHGPESGQLDFVTKSSGSGTLSITVSPGGYDTANETGVTGSGNPFNINQLTVFNNVFLKL